MSTPLQIAKEFCANYKTDGSCLGVRFDNTGRIVGCSPSPCALHAKDPARCEYFEECVLPQADTAAIPRDAKAIQSAREKYREERGIRGEVRYCGCGKPLQKRKRYCPDCRLKRRRSASHGKRGPEVVVKENNTPKTLENSGGFEADSKKQGLGSTNPQIGQLTTTLEESK